MDWLDVLKIAILILWAAICFGIALGIALVDPEEEEDFDRR